MNDIKRLEEKIDRIEKKLDLGYPLRNLLDCSFDIDLKIRPLIPTTATQAMYIEQLQIRLKAEIYPEIKAIEDKINKYLRYI